ncbi:MAG: ATPase [Marmoricola sp.]|nr:ATPase [Marmoricola sp.]
MVSPDPVMHLLAGPNGSGKSTFAARVLEPSTHLPFVNAGVIAANRWPGDEEVHAYEASELAAAERALLLRARSSFITETVFSHHSKVELVTGAASLGYRVYLHVMVVPEDTTVRRVAQRVGRGGHTVPEEKIRDRYQRLWPLIVQAREVAHRTYFYENARAADPFRLIATYEEGALVGVASWPRWTPAPLVTRREPLPPPRRGRPDGTPTG